MSGRLYNYKYRWCRKTATCTITRNHPVNTTEMDFTWAACPVCLLLQHSAKGAAEQLEGLSAALLRHPVHHLDDSLHAGGFQRHRLKERSGQGSSQLRHHTLWVPLRREVCEWASLNQQLTWQYHLFSRSRALSLRTEDFFFLLSLEKKTYTEISRPM